MPMVLILYRQAAGMAQFQEELNTIPEPQCRYATAALEDMWSGKLLIPVLAKQG